MDRRGDLQPGFSLPGATVTVDAVTAPLALPAIDGSGHLVLPAGLSDHVLETLLAGLLQDADAPWLPPLVQALGLGDPGAAGDAFAELFSNPRSWVVARLRSLLSAADPAAVNASLGQLANVLAALTGTQPSSPACPRRQPPRRQRRRCAARRVCRQRQPRPRRPAPQPRRPAP